MVGHNLRLIKRYVQTIQKIERRTPLHKPTFQAGEQACNCQKKEQCPLEGNCLAKGIVYHAQVTPSRQTETYVGLTATEFKSRFRNHQVSFNKETHKNDTELSKHIWQLKGKEQRLTIKWKILAKAKPYSNLTKRCNLCTTEKHFIIYHQTGVNNIKQTKRTNFYMLAPTKVHTQI